MRADAVGGKDKVMKTTGFALAAALVCSPLAAQDAGEQGTKEQVSEASEEAVQEEAVEADDKDKIICRRTAIVGSKFKKKLCGTQEMWDSMAARGRDATAEFQRKGRGIRQGN